MGMGQAFAQELEHEGAVTRKLLERIPDSTLGWKPHDKSMSMGRLAYHVAEVPGWIGMIVGKDVFEMTSGEGGPGEAKSGTELLRSFDEGLKGALSMLKGASDDILNSKWTMKVNGQVTIEMPKAAVVRVWVLNHLIHHRGQLSVYLRLNQIAVPAIYGPSADEQG